MKLFFQLKAVNRLSIEHIHHKDNGIQLCVACHRNFDNSYPAWVFIPTDIQFFINFETSDWTRRSNSARPGLPFPPRLCPSVAQYSQRGGLYDSYIERNYFFRNVVTEHLLMPGRSGLQPASTRWHGDPMAALNRGFKMVGIAPDIFPDAVRNALTSLNLLYRTHDNSQPLTAASSIFRRPGPGAYGPGDSNDDGGNVGNLRAPPPPHPTPKGRQAAKPGQAGSSRPSHKGKKRPVDQYADRRRSARIQDRFFRKHFGRSKEEQDRARRLLEDPPAEELILRREITDGIWKWGPMSSSNEAMMAPKKTSEQKTHIGTKKARLSQGLLSPSTGGRV